MTKMQARFFTSRCLAALLLLANVLECLPLLHHHEEEQPCIQVSGKFVYVEALETHSHTEKDAAHQAGLIGFRLGESHDHPFCALCQLSSSLLIDDPQNALAHHHTDQGRSHHAPGSGILCHRFSRSRAPPQNA